MKHILSLLLSLIFAATLHAQTTDQLIAKSDSLISIGTEFYESGNYAEALPYFTEAHEIEKTLQRDKRTDLCLALCYLYIGEAKLTNGDNSGINDFKQFCRHCKDIYGENSEGYATSLETLAYYNKEIGNYTEAIKLTENALAIHANILGKDNSEYIESMYCLAEYNFEIGNYEQALKIAQEGLTICERISGEISIEYANCLYYLAKYNYRLGNYQQAIKITMNELSIRDRNSGKENEKYAKSLINLAVYNYKSENYTQALEFIQEAMSILERISLKDSPKYAECMYHWIYINLVLGNSVHTFTLAQDALAIALQTHGNYTLDNALKLHNLADYYFLLRNYEDALYLESQALTIEKSILNSDHPDLLETLKIISFFAFRSRNLPLLEQYTTEANTLSTDYVRNTFANLTASERQAFWDANKYWYETSNNLYAYRHPTPALISNALNATLLAKGILLNTERNFSDLILESGDAESATLFSQLQSTRNQLNRLYAMPPAQRPADTDSLERLAREQERRLLDRSKIYGDFTRNLTVRWQDIRQHLTDSDIAIEFVSFPLETDSVTTTRYAAYIIGSRMEAPAMVPLFDDTQLARIPRQDYYTTPALSRLVWGKLRSYIDTARTIYFAPAGELYNIAVESLPALSGEGILADTHTIHRLSSTRQIALARDRHIARSAALYGGLAYDAGIDILQSDQQRYAHVRDIAPAPAADSLNLRGGISDLPGSRIEIRDISASFRNTAVEPQIYTGAEGTEASFKALSGKKTSIIHIATHGFYWTQTEARRLRHLNFLRLNENAPRHTEDKALTRSGLLFAGANNALTGKPIPEDTQDGILTAHEIARLDLSGLDLVVLSACQTGLGEITGDGVFGLQRGFKKAGAESILMSLWKVDDDATRILMTRFYEHLLAGHTKHDSLLAAQRHLRQYRTPDNTRPYATPRYWAAFILLDAI